MPLYKYKNRAGVQRWGYQFSLPGSSREDRRRISKSGFATKREAVDAQAQRHAEELQRLVRESAAVGIAAAAPTTLAALLKEFFVQHVDGKLAPKTVERYHEQVACLNADLLEMTLDEIKPLHLHREWNRLHVSGGHHRKTKQPRSMSAKTVRNIAGVVSSAFAHAIRWGVVASNPVTQSDPPRLKKHYGIALTVAQQALVFETARGPWCMRAFLECSAALGTRRGELLALRWSDVTNGRATIARSLTQTKEALEFKGTKTERSRVVKIPTLAVIALEEHRKRQNEFRRQFGPDYRADLDLIFANPDGTPLKPDSISAAVSLLFKRLKLPKGANLHSLRHTHTSQLLASGVPLPVVSARLGHSSTRVTAEIYSHMIHGQDDEAAAKWDDYQKANTKEQRANVQ